MKHTWTDEMDRCMIQGFNEGLSASDVAKILNDQFNINLTRNAVIGRKDRLSETVAMKNASVDKAMGKLSVITLSKLEAEARHREILAHDLFCELINMGIEIYTEEYPDSRIGVCGKNGQRSDRSG